MDDPRTLISFEGFGDNALNFVIRTYLPDFENRIEVVHQLHQTIYEELNKAGIRPNIMIDCSHANSNKDPALQPLVMENVANQILEGNSSIVGLMVESHLNWGNQAIPKDLCDLKYGVSITDACIDWDTTEKAVMSMHNKLKDVLPKRQRS